jgi:hypothetical protein
VRTWRPLVDDLHARWVAISTSHGWHLRCHIPVVRIGDLVRGREPESRRAELTSELDQLTRQLTSAARENPDLPWLAWTRAMEAANRAPSEANMATLRRAVRDVRKQLLQLYEIS